MNVQNQPKVIFAEAQLFVQLADLWVLAQVAECLGVDCAHELRRGDSTAFEAVLTSMNDRLRRENPQVLEAMANVEHERTGPSPAAGVAARYMVAECFEHFDDVEAAARVRCGGADELLVSTVTLAADRLSRAILGVGGDEFAAWDELDPESYEEVCQRSSYKLRLLGVKFYLAEVIEPVAPDLAEDLREGVSRGSDWYFDLDELAIKVLGRLNPGVLQALRKPWWPSYRTASLMDLVFDAGEFGYVACFAYASLGIDVDEPPDRNWRSVWERAAGRLRTQLALADRTFEDAEGPSPRRVH